MQDVTVGFENKTHPANLPFASVIVVTRDRAPSLRRTLNALQSLEYPQYEVIVVDNDSKDETKNVIQASGAKYVFSPSNCGIGPTRQKGVDAAAGEIVAFCDDDCVPAPRWLYHLVRRICEDRGLGLVAGQVINVGFPESKGYAEAKRNKGRSRMGPNGTILFVENPEDAEFFGNMNLAFRKEIIDLAGGYDPFFRLREEIDLELRIKKLGYQVAFEPQASLEHHYTGIHHKRRHLFYGPDLIRLYLCMKHYSPNTARGWLKFLRVETRLLGRGIIRTSRMFGAAVVKRRPDKLRAVAIETFNILSSRLALPWIYWRAKSNFHPGKQNSNSL